MKSTVLLIPAAQQVPLNAYLEQLGWGANNLSRELLHSDGSIWFGAHAWLDAEQQAQLQTLAPVSTEDGVDYSAALAALLVCDCDNTMPLDEEGNRCHCSPLQLFEQALANNGLSVIPAEVV